MALISSKNSETIKKHGEFIVEQAHFNQDKMQTSAKRILILKDLEKLGIELENVNKSKQIENAQKDTEKFLLEQGIKKEEIVRIFAFSERLSTIRIEFRDEFGRNGADLKIRQTFNTHKLRTVRHLSDKYPGEIRPDLQAIKLTLLDKYNVAVQDEYKIDGETLDEFIQVSLISAGHRNGKKNYIEFTDPTCPNYNLLVYNYEENHNPFVGFEWNEAIPSQNLQQLFNKNPEKIAYYAFKTYGLHVRRTQDKACWNKVETDWQNSGEEPPQPAQRRAGSTRRK